MIHVGLSSLESAVPLVTGDPIYCQGIFFFLFYLQIVILLGCNVVMSKMSKLESVGEGVFNWTCEFCKQTNKEVRVESGEVPTNDSVDYILLSSLSRELIYL